MALGVGTILGARGALLVLTSSAMAALGAVIFDSTGRPWAGITSAPLHAVNSSAVAATTTKRVAS